MQLLANMIFPAFMHPYVISLLMPLIAILIVVSEWKMLVYLLKQDAILDPTIEIKKERIFIMVLGANIVSSVAGMLLAPHLPTGVIYVEGTNLDGTTYSIPRFDDSWGTYVNLSYILAYVLSVVIEGSVLRLCSKRFCIPTPWKKSVIINSVSYMPLLLLNAFH